MHEMHIENDLYSDVTGVILAGGKSSRMGRDKATMKMAGMPLFERMLGVLQGLFANVLIAGDRPDLARPRVPCHPDRYPGSALGGLYTGLLEARTDWIFVAPCDMPHPDPRLIRALLAHRAGHQVVVPRTGELLEPLFALYHKDCLPTLRDMLEEGRYRIYDSYDRMSVRYVSAAELPAGWEASLLNVNTPEDYRKLQAQGNMDLRVRSKVWLEAKEQPLLGEGRMRLLRAIHRTGSISAAARETGISYRKAWGHLEQMERHLGTPLARRRKGGPRGGRTTLTSEALLLIEHYDALKRDVQTYVDRKFAERFGPILNGERK